MIINPKKLLKGLYEAELLPRDFSPDRIVPDYAFNVLNSYGLLYRPVVDEDYLANGGQKPFWPDNKPFAVCLTHDVDMVSLHSFKQLLRKSWWESGQGTSFLKAGRSIVQVIADMAGIMMNYRKGDPLHCYEKWLELEEKYGSRSTFFFSPGWSNVHHHHHTDPEYELYDQVMFDGQNSTVAEMMREMDRRNWEIGLHPSWYSFDDVDEMKRQKEAIENVLGHDIVSVRQHYLHYDIRVTPRVQSEAGFKYDSTIGFNDNIGFRFGTSYAWYVYDVEKEHELPLLEIPLIVQEGALLDESKGMRLDVHRAYHYVMQVIDAVERVGGIITLLWHPNWIMKQQWWDLFIDILDYVRKKNAFIGSVREIGTWWENAMTSELAILSKD